MSSFLTVAQVAEELGVSPRTVQRWVAHGDLEAVRLPGGRIRVPLPALQRMLLAGSTLEPAPAPADTGHETAGHEKPEFFEGQRLTPNGGEACSEDR